MKRHYHLLKLIAYSSPAFLFGSLHGQQADPFVKDGEKIPKRSAEVVDTSKLPKQIFTTVEIFSLPTNEAAKLLRLRVSDRKTYETVVKMVEEGSAKQQLLSSLTSLPGQYARRELTQESRKAEESNADKKTSPKQGQSKLAKTGLVLEIEAQMGMPDFVPLTKKGATLLRGLKDLNVSSDPFAGPDPKTAAALKVQKERILEALGNKDVKTVTPIALRISPTLIEQFALLKTGKGLSDSSDPLFDVGKISTEIRAASGDVVLLGTFSPTSKLKEGDEGQEEVWLAFVTATAKVVGL